MNEFVRLTCQSCDQQKQNLFPRPSRLIGLNHNMCRDCIAREFEPRYAISLAFRSANDDVRRLAKEYIQKKKYVDAETRPILAEEIV